MEKRLKELSELKNFVTKVDNNISMVLQSIQWDQKKVLQGIDMVVCSYNINHRIPATSKEKHEKECMLKHWNYSKDDKFLPEPAFPESKTCITLGKDKIQEIINNASKTDPLFKKGIRNKSPEPMTHDRLQSTYTADERKSLYDAVIATVPTYVEELDLVLPSGSEEVQNSSKEKTTLQLLAEQRDMKRRRVKYRVATKSKNYSQVLHEVIRNQMEMYSGTQQSIETNKETIADRNNHHSNSKYKNEVPPDKSDLRSKYDKYSKKDIYDKHDDYSEKKREQKEYHHQYERSSSKYDRYYTDTDRYSGKEGKYVDHRKETRDQKVYKPDPTDKTHKSDSNNKYDYSDKDTEQKYRDKYKTSTSKQNKYKTKKDNSNPDYNYKEEKTHSEQNTKYNKRCFEDEDEKYNKIKKYKSSKNDKCITSSKSCHDYSEKIDDKSRSKHEKHRY